MEFKGDLQELLSLGYIYLLLLGISSDTIFFSIIGINIVSFSDILDVMISPFGHLTKSFAFPMVVALIIGAGIFYRRKVDAIYEKKAQQNITEETRDKKLRVNQAWLGVTAMAIFGAYVGLGMGGGMAMREKILNGNFKPDHRITFETGETMEVKLIGNNSGYLFYIPVGETNPIISPISEHMRHLQRLPESN